MENVAKIALAKFIETFGPIHEPIDRRDATDMPRPSND
jgi:hypothetical protein